MLTLCVVAFAIRLAWQVTSGSYEHPETWEYDELARNLVSGRGYVFDFMGSEWRTFGTPLYPALLAALHALGGASDVYWPILLFQAAMSAALCLTAYAIARRLWDEAAGRLAAVALAAHPGLVIYSSKVHELTFEALLASLFLIALIDAARGTAQWGWLRVGLAGGLAALTRPTLAAFVVPGLLLLLRRQPRRPALLALSLVLVLTLPWQLRNAVVLDSASASSPYNCVTFWMGNNPETTGGTIGKDGRHVFESMPAELRTAVVGRPEREQGSAFCAAALDYARGDILGTLAWWAQKIGFFWTFAPMAGVFYPPSWIELYRVAYAVEALLVFGGMIALARTRSWLGLSVVSLEFFVVSVGQGLFYVEGRHRLLLEPVMASVAAVGALSLTRAAITTLRLAGHHDKAREIEASPVDDA